MNYRHIKPLEDKEFEEITQKLSSTDTTATVARGSDGGTTYLLEPRMWIRQIVDGAQKKLMYSASAYQQDVTKGFKDLVIPKRNRYLADEITGEWKAVVTPGTAVNFTDLSQYDGVTVTPLWKNHGVAITYDVIQTNALDYVALGREELTYHAGDVVDIAVVDAFVGATAATSSVAGASTIYGGDATDASELSAGDIITTDMVAEGARKLKSKIVNYWTLGSGEFTIATSTMVKNPWANEGDFVLHIAPEQEEAFRTDSQFVNAAEYGSDKVLKTGEIGDYLGVAIVVSNNTKQYATSATNRDGTTNSSISTNTCVLTKMRKGAALAFSKRPTLHVVDFPRELEVDLILEQAYGTNIIHDDSICFFDLAQA